MGVGRHYCDNDIYLTAVEGANVCSLWPLAIAETSSWEPNLALGGPGEIDVLHPSSARKEGAVLHSTDVHARDTRPRSSRSSAGDAEDMNGLEAG